MRVRGVKERMGSEVEEIFLSFFSFFGVINILIIYFRSLLNKMSVRQSQENSFIPLGVISPAGISKSESWIRKDC